MQGSAKTRQRPIVKYFYLKCQFFSKTRAFFSKKRAFFFMNCHFRKLYIYAILFATSVQVLVQVVVQDNCLIISTWCKKCNLTESGRS